MTNLDMAERLETSEERSARLKHLLAVNRPLRQTTVVMWAGLAYNLMHYGKTLMN